MFNAKKSFTINIKGMIVKIHLRLRGPLHCRLYIWENNTKLLLIEHYPVGKEVWASDALCSFVHSENLLDRLHC